MGTLVRVYCYCCYVQYYGRKSRCFDTYCNLYWCNFTDICRTGKCMGTDIDDDFLQPVCDNIIPFSLLGRDVYLLIYVTSDVCLVDCDMTEKCEKQ